MELSIIGETVQSSYPSGTGPGTKILFTRTSGNTTCTTRAPAGGL